MQSRHWAEVAIAAGVDILVAQGTEAGGHTGAVGTLPLLQIVLELTDLPVVAAGGIASGRGLAAVLAAGAVGGWVGTPFLLAEEARNSPAARERIARSDETETLYTSVYDRLQDKGWPAEFGARAIRTAFGARWTGHEDELGSGTEPREEFVRGSRGAGLRRRAHLRGSVDRHARHRSASRGNRRGDRGSGARAARPLVVGRPSAPEGGVDRRGVPSRCPASVGWNEAGLSPNPVELVTIPLIQAPLLPQTSWPANRPATGTNVILRTRAGDGGNSRGDRPVESRPEPAQHVLLPLEGAQRGAGLPCLRGGEWVGIAEDEDAGVRRLRRDRAVDLLEPRLRPVMIAARLRSNARVLQLPRPHVTSTST